MTAMDSIADVATADVAAGMATMPRFEDGCINLQELLRQLAESVVNEIMSAEADQLCEATKNSRNGYRERMLTTCVGTLTLRISKLRVGSFFPDDVLERCQRVDRAIVSAVAVSVGRIQPQGTAVGNLDQEWDKEDTCMFSTEQRRIAIETFMNIGSDLMRDYHICLHLMSSMFARLQER